jgi:glucose-1-phosphate thymidylyltransferase
LGNKPIIAHIVEGIISAGINDIILIVGFKKDKIIEFMTKTYSDKCKLTFLVQKERKGLGHAIYIAKEILDGEPVLIALGDSIYDKSFSQMVQKFHEYPSWDGALTTKAVENPQDYGIVITDPQSSLITQMVEKPDEPESNKAITGVYLIKDSLKLLNVLEKVIKANTTGKGGEIQLTDVLQKMINEGSKLGEIDSGDWYDCGNKASLLRANRYILNKESTIRNNGKNHNSVFIQPVNIEAESEVINSIIGPYVSIGTGTKISRCIISSTIIGSYTNISNGNITDSVIGDKVKINLKSEDLDLGDNAYQ